MRFRSILFGDTEEPARTAGRTAPDFFHDLNLDQVVDAVTAGREEYALAPFFYTALTDVDLVRYRQEVFQDLEKQDVRDVVQRFTEAMQVMRSQLGLISRLHSAHQQQRWHLNAVQTYCDAVSDLTVELDRADLASQGFLGLRDYLSRYARREDFTALRALANDLLRELSAVQYCVLIDGSRVTVGHYHDEPDYSDEVVSTFARFQQRAVKDHRTRLRASADLDRVEADILNLVARLFPDLFGALGTFCAQNRTYLDNVIGRFDRELQFYLAYADYLTPLHEAGLQTCYPSVGERFEGAVARETYDLALAAKLTAEGSPVVSNDFFLAGPERILVVSGPNQGGKTTFARTVGQLHHLASLGCPVPGADVRLALTDQIFTHFERQEDLVTLSGKLRDDLERIHAILDRATSASLIVLNEIFTSTTLQDALFLSKEILGRVTALDAVCVCVTFLDELSTLNAKTVSMVSTVVVEDPAVRTYKLVRRSADGRAYALAIAEKYALTYACLTTRLAP